MGGVRDIIAACCETEFVVRLDLIYIYRLNQNTA